MLSELVDRVRGLERVLSGEVMSRLRRLDTTEEPGLHSEITTPEPRGVNLGDLEDPYPTNPWTALEPP
jgi:hypothetical protein